MRTYFLYGLAGFPDSVSLTFAAPEESYTFNDSGVAPYDWGQPEDLFIKEQGFIATLELDATNVAGFGTAGLDAYLEYSDDAGFTWTPLVQWSFPSPVTSPLGSRMSVTAAAEPGATALPAALDWRMRYALNNTSGGENMAYSNVRLRCDVVPNLITGAFGTS